jgi:hypothetical protein
LRSRGVSSGISPKSPFRALVVLPLRELPLLLPAWSFLIGSTHFDEEITRKGGSTVLYDLEDLIRGKEWTRGVCSAGCMVAH